MTSATALSVTGVPAGATSSFSPATITPVPGSSTLTIGNTGAVSPGSYQLTITGTSTTPALQRSRTVGLDVFTAAPSAPSLSTPANGAVGVGLGPLFTWTASTQPTSYVVEIATDAAFTNIVYTSPAITATSFQAPNVLSLGTTYRARVRGTNICGSGNNSTVATFTTRSAPGTCSGGD